MPLLKPGPKTEPFLEALSARTLSLDDLTMEMARVLSRDGQNASQGIRAAVRFAYDCYQADRFKPGTTSAAPVSPASAAPDRSARPRREPRAPLGAPRP